MIIELTEKQARSLDNFVEATMQVLDPRTKKTYFLLRAEDYESVREILEEKNRQHVIARIARRNAVSLFSEPII
jgi:pyruvate kinase